MPRGRVTGSSDASGVRTTIDYGLDGNVRRRVVDATHASATSTRQGLGTTAVDYEYDGAGRLVLADDGVAPVARRFDSRGLLLNERTATTAIGWSYDIAGRVVGFEFPSGRRVTFERTLGGGLRRIVDAATAVEILQSWPWGLASLREQRWRGTTHRTESRDGAGWLLHLEEQRTLDGTTMLDLRQVADMRGLPAARWIVVGPAAELELFGCDSQGRLVNQNFGDGVLDVAGLAATDAATVQADHDVVVVVARRDSSLHRSRRRSSPPSTPTAPGVGAPSAGRGRAADDVVHRGNYGAEHPTGRPVDDDDALPADYDGDTFVYDGTRNLTGVAHAPAVRRSRSYATPSVGRDGSARPEPTSGSPTTGRGRSKSVRRRRPPRSFVFQVPVSRSRSTTARPVGRTSTPTAPRSAWSTRPAPSSRCCARRVRNRPRPAPACGRRSPRPSTGCRLWKTATSSWHRAHVSPRPRHVPGTGSGAPCRRDQPLQLRPRKSDGVHGRHRTHGESGWGHRATQGRGVRLRCGTRYVTEWRDEALYHWANAVAGGLSTLVKGLLVEPAKQIYDMGGGALEMAVKGFSSATTNTSS